MTRTSALMGGVAAAMLSLAFATPASAGFLDFLIPQPAPQQAAATPADAAGMREGRSVAMTGAGDATDLQVAKPAALQTRMLVQDPTQQTAGTITVDTKNRYLYLSMANGEAMRYGIGVGRDGFTWSGNAHIARKAEWPNWTPPKEMIARRPDIPHFMKGGIGNPLGARAMYLYNGKGDTGYRIHGTNEPDTIGQAVSSGCIRMMNNDVIDLYTRVKPGTKVIVLPG